MLSTLEDTLAESVNTLAHRWHCSAAAYSSAWDEDGEQFDFHRKEADKTFRVIGRSMLPWYKRWSEDEGKELAQLWKEFKEEEKDPEFQKWRNKVKQDMQDSIDAAKLSAQRMDNVGKVRKEMEKERLKKRRRKRGRKR